MNKDEIAEERSHRLAVVILVLAAYQVGCQTHTVLTEESTPVQRPDWVYSDAPPPPEKATYYRRLEYGVDDLPWLIERLDDPTPLPGNRYLFGGRNTVADTALVNIHDIIEDLPALSFIDSSYAHRIETIGYGAYYEFVDAGLVNRRKFKARLERWVNSADPEEKKKWGLRKWAPVPGY